MAKRAIYKGNGELEINIPSKKASTVLKKGDSIALDTEKDIRVAKALRSFGLVVEDVKEATQEAVAPAQPEAPAYTFEELYSKRADDLRKIVADLGVEVEDNASKKEMTNAILKKLGE